jgi:hypothetical protein
MSAGIKSTEVARVKPASEEQRLIIGAIRHDRVSGEVHGEDGPDQEILDEVLANPASSGQAPRAPKSISSREGRHRSILGIVVEAWRSWRSKLLGWLGNPGKHRCEPIFLSEAPRIVLLVVRIPTRKFSTPSPFSATWSRFQAQELGTQIVAGFAQPRLRA